MRPFLLFRRRRICAERGCCRIHLPERAYLWLSAALPYRLPGLPPAHIYPPVARLSVWSERGLVLPGRVG